MPAPRVLIALTLCAAAAGAVAGAFAIVLREPPMATPGTVPGGGRGEGAGGAQSGANASTGDHGATGATGVSDGAPPRGLTARIDDADAGVRDALALELLREGPSALPQARALRPATAAGRELQNRLVAALDKMALLRRAGDYGKLPEHIRMRLDLDAFASVVPESLLVGERVAYWEREIEAVRRRLRAGVAHPGEEAVARLELALAQRAAGALDAAAYAALATELLPSADAWIESRRADRSAATAEIRELEAQVRRLRP